MFCNFCEKFENSKWLPFWARQIFFENWDGYSAQIPCGSKIVSKSLYFTRFSRYKHFCVLWFLRKIRKFKMAAQTFWARQKFFENWGSYSAVISCGSKISSKSLYLARFSRLSIFVKNLKIQNGRHFGRDKNFLKIGMATVQTYPADQKIRQNRSI